MIKEATTKFETESGSVYEADISGLRIRRLEGQRDPTPRQGKDGEWKEVLRFGDFKIGYPAVFVWNLVDEEIGIVVKTTVTSNLISIF
jgi:hypothetical protein